MPREQMNFLTDADVEVLKRLIQRETNRRVNTDQRPGVPEGDWHENQQTETYIAKTPEGGIDALFDPGDDSTPAEPGYALCDVYYISYDVEEEKYFLKRTYTKQHLVFNLSTEAVGGNVYTLIDRDKGGQYILGGGAPTAQRESVFNLCKVLNDDGVMTGLRVTWLDPDGETMRCEEVLECPPCSEVPPPPPPPDDPGTGTGTWAEEVTYNILVETYNEATGGTPGSGTPLQHMSVMMVDSDEFIISTDANGEAVFTGVSDDLGTTPCALLPSTAVYCQIYVEPPTGSPSYSYGESVDASTVLGSPVNITFSIISWGTGTGEDDGTAGTGTDTDTDVVVFVSGNAPSGRSVTLNGVHNTTTDGSGYAYFYGVAVSTTNSVVITPAVGDASSSWTASWSGGSGGPGTGYTASPFTTVLGTTSTVTFIISASGGG